MKQLIRLIKAIPHACDRSGQKRRNFFNFKRVREILPGNKNERNLVATSRLPRRFGSSGSESFAGFRLSASLRPVEDPEAVCGKRRFRLPG
ncbi:hypothetical protein D1AOALGA4SA_3269 [Olavius algarvensis Delta 1 endosymbiont]|nr:hypothetical protein D1AOALGA4SA_3269 [Olavius algarvensis Delta 1 endosymbiont]